MVLWLTIKLPIGSQNTNWKCPTENPKQKKVSCNHRPKPQVATTARWQKLLADLFSPKPQPTTKKKTLTSALPCSSRPYAAAGQIAITRWRTPTKLTGDPNLPLHNTPSEAICAICITFHEMSIPPHCSKFIDFSIIIVASSSIGAGDDHETDAGWFGGRADSNCFFVMRKKFKRCSI